MKIQLPEAFCQEMKSLLGEEYGQYLDSFDQPRNFGLRINTLKWTPDQWGERLLWPTEPVPWTENGFFYSGQVQPSKDPYYYAGLYYLQEPSAMAPGALLPVEPGDLVLDLCAAPGGKSTELGARLKGQGMLVANDISNSRAKGLLKNLELFGIANACVTSETPERLAQVFPRFFHSILVDAPCSGEGMFRKDPDMIKDWLERGPKYYSRIQKEILEQAVNMLKPGGYLLYSTCTFSRLENEDMVQWVLETFPDMEVEPLPVFTGARGGAGLTGCLRLFPHRVRGEGHFMALFRRRGGEEKGSRPAKERQRGKKDDFISRGEFADFLRDTRIPWDLSRIVKKQDRIYYLPEGFLEDTGLRYLRTGLFMGTIKNERFEPSQAMAMVLKEELYANSLSFDREDHRVIRYLKGETLVLKEGEGPRKGWCLVCVDGFGLGFARGNNMTLKNKYYPGWRWQ